MLRAKHGRCTDQWRACDRQLWLLVGMVLTTVGVLYFFDIKFCEDKTQAITALTGGLLVFAGSAMALASSSTSFFYKAQQVQTSACELEAETAHPRESPQRF